MTPHSFEHPHFVTVDGLRIAFRRTGAGLPVVLLHGGLSDSRDWRPQLEDLSSDFMVIAWDAPGCGQSSDPPEDWMMPDYADCLAGFIQALKLESPHVLGLSWGGGLAIQLFARFPALPRSLILASAYAGWAGSLPKEEVERRVQQALRDSELPPEQFVPGFISTLFTESVPQDVVDEVTAIACDSRPIGMRTMLHAFGACDLRNTLPTINVPTLLLYGDMDVRSPLDVAEEMHEQIPGSQLVVMPGVGHMANAEAPGLFDDEVRTFLRKVESRS